MKRFFRLVMALSGLWFGAYCAGAVIAQEASGAGADGVPAAGSATCALQGSPNVFIEGKGMLRLGDVLACPGLRYEVVPSVFVNGQPAVRLVPEGGCLVGGANSVTLEGGAAATAGDAVCLPN
ncbi:MAG: PAAR domain-containing protein [Neomegalonema sp.]|nr:PAAR domain-containing protein [Neomegalonema sp.]